MLPALSFFYLYCIKFFYRGYIGIPQLVIEVLSTSNLDDDLISKKDLYEEYRYLDIGLYHQ